MVAGTSNEARTELDVWGTMSIFLLRVRGVHFLSHTQHSAPRHSPRSVESAVPSERCTRAFAGRHQWSRGRLIVSRPLYQSLPAGRLAQLLIQIVQEGVEL